ncbi:MAG: hypothetical protein QE278_04200 [Limnobacter sp.]|nr:hypothetical protein [Limnobacter sp.]
MSYAICGQVFELANLQNGQALVEQTLKRSKLRRHSDYVSRVILLATTHFADCLTELAQWSVGASNCMNVWGGCVSGLVFDGKLHGKDPALLVMVLGEHFEPGKSNLKKSELLTLCLADSDHGDARLSGSPMEQTGPAVPANVMGLLTYGANYAHNPRVDNGRPCKDTRSAAQLNACKLLVLNSEGLEFLTEPKEVTDTNGLFLLKVENKPASAQLQCPVEQTRPVGLRLQVIHSKGEMWIPVMSINPDGTLSLAAPVSKGQKVRLAKRGGKAMAVELKQWAPLINEHFSEGAPEIGIIMAGVERTQMCHEHENDVAEVIRALPRTHVIGLLGQATWLENTDELLSPPRNNRLCVSLFNSN